MDAFNLFRDETIGDESDPPGYRGQSAQLAPRFGASRLAMTVYDLPPGQAICPYHFHWGDEEWLVVVSGTPRFGRPTVNGRRSRGMSSASWWGRRARTGCTTRATTPSVALFSNKHEFGIIEYPDSDKIGVWGRRDESLDHVIRRSPDLDYWDGERL